MAAQPPPNPLPSRSSSYSHPPIRSALSEDTCDQLSHESSIDLFSDGSPTRVLNYCTKLTQRPSRSALQRRRTTAPTVWNTMDALQLPPSTPIRLPPPPRFCEDSPFSDYFSQTGDSPPNTLQLKLIQRLKNIGARIELDDLDDEVFDSVHARLSALEHALSDLDVRSREPAGMVDSGVFMDHGDEPPGLDWDTASSSTKDNASSGSRSTSGLHSGSLLRQAQDVLTRVTKANAELRSRFKELKNAHDNHLHKKDEALNQVLHLRTQNDQLRSTLSFTHSDLLLLSLQLKGLQVQTSPYLGNIPEGEGIMKAIERWKVDWKEVDDRLKTRMRKYYRRASDIGQLGDLDGYDEVLKSKDFGMERFEERMPRAVDILRVPFETAKEWMEHADEVLTESTAVEDGTDTEDDMTPRQADDERKASPDKFDQPKKSAQVLFSKHELVVQERTMQRPSKEKQPAQLTPWQELCHSLALFAGMADDLTN